MNRALILRLSVFRDDIRQRFVNHVLQEPTTGILSPVQFQTVDCAQEFPKFALNTSIPEEVTVGHVLKSLLPARFPFFYQHFSEEIRYERPAIERSSGGSLQKLEQNLYRFRKMIRRRIADQLQPHQITREPCKFQLQVAAIPSGPLRQ